MLQRDSELRLSEEVQQRYRGCGDNWNAKERVTQGVKRQVCAEFGFASDMKGGLDLLRSSISLFPGDEAILGAAFYLHRNICRPCPVPMGAAIPDVPLFQRSLSGVSQTTLRATCQSSAKLTLLYAGSIT